MIYLSNLISFALVGLEWNGRVSGLQAALNWEGLTNSGIDFLSVYFSIYVWLLSQTKYKQSSVSFVFICASYCLKEKLKGNFIGHFFKIIISFGAGSCFEIFLLHLLPQCINFKTGKPKWCIVFMEESIYRKDWNFTKPGLWAVITRFLNKTMSSLNWV